MVDACRGSAGETGSPSSAKLTFAEMPRNFIRSMFSTRSLGSSRGSTSSRNVRRGSSATTTTGARNSVPSSSATPTARPSLVITRSTGDVEPDLGAERLRGPGEHLGEAAVAALVERPRAEVAVVLAHLVEQQHQPGARRHRADLGADDAGRRVVALDGVVLEVVVEPVGGAAGEQPDDVVHAPSARRRRGGRAATATSAWSSGSLPKTLGGALSNSGWTAWHDPVEVVVVAVVGVGVVRRVAA